MTAKNTCLKFLIKTRSESYLRTHNREYSGHSLRQANAGSLYTLSLNK